MRSKKLTAVLAASVALALPVLFASPAAAATLPATDSLWAISCNPVGEDYEAGLFSLNPADAQATAIGNGTGLDGGDCAFQPAWNPVTNQAYYISDVDNELATIDLTTGLSTVVGEITGPGLINYPTAMAIGLDGAAYAWDRNGGFFSLDLATGAVTLIADTTLDIWSFSVDPTTGLFYAVDYAGIAYSITAATGAATVIGTILADGGDQIYSLQIDTAGAWWVSVWTGTALTEVWYGARPADSASVQYELVGIVDDTNPDYVPFIEALLITYPPKLAATGTDSSAVLLGGGAVAMLLIVGGAMFLGRRRATA